MKKHKHRRQILTSINLYQWWLCSNEYLYALSQGDKRQIRFYRDYLIRYNKCKWIPVEYTNGFEVVVKLHPELVK